jgi:hypothetical protein
MGRRGVEGGGLKELWRGWSSLYTSRTRSRDYNVPFSPARAEAIHGPSKKQVTFQVRDKHSRIVGIRRECTVSQVMALSKDRSLTFMWRLGLHGHGLERVHS